MSRIYNALKKSDETEPNMIVQLIDGNQEQSVGTAPPHEPPHEEFDSRVVETLREAESLREPVAAESGEYRSVSLRIPAGIPIFPFDGTDPRAAEEYRVIRTNLLQHPLQARMIAMTSATPGDGKTISAINLAGIMALKSQSRVLIVDADLRHSTVAEALGIEPSPGLRDVLRGQCSLEDAIVRIEQMPKLHVLPCGSGTGNPAELLDSALCRSVFAALREQFSYVFVDTTPIAPVADFKLVQQFCDGALVVLRPDHTNRRAFAEAISIAKEAKLLGTIVNAYEDWFFWRKSGTYYYYGERSGKRRSAWRKG